MILYLVKNSKLKIVNTTQELLKVMNGASQTVSLEMHQAIMYVLNTRHLGLKWKPKGKEKKHWEMFCFKNSDYHGDIVTRIIISRIVVHVLALPIS